MVKLSFSSGRSDIEKNKSKELYLDSYVNVVFASKKGCKCVLVVLFRKVHGLYLCNWNYIFMGSVFQRICL
jgi:hypothetical protein